MLWVAAQVPVGGAGLALGGGVGGGLCGLIAPADAAAIDPSMAARAIANAMERVRCCILPLRR
jgi:hypothetical protein